MKTRFATSWRQRRRGVTLVEAVVGTALLGSLLVGILLADARQRRQTWRAGRRIEACAVADELLEQWWRQPDSLPRSDSGSVSGHEGWTWRTHTATSRDARRMRAEVVVLEIFAPDLSQAQDSAAAAVLSREPAARVELLVPDGLLADLDASEALE